MKVLLVRHAVAEDRADFAKSGKPDTERPLTRDGRDKMRRIARAAKVVAADLDLIASSPLKRAIQTARLLTAAYSDVEVVKLDSLAPEGSHAESIAWLAAHSNLRCVALVGHEPSLSTLLAQLLPGKPAGFHSFKKGGLALVSFEGKPATGAGELEWLLTPSIARHIGNVRG